MRVRMRVDYPAQTDEIEVEHDDLPRGAVIAGLFIGVDFEDDRARLDLPEGPLEVSRGAPVRFEVAGLNVAASLE